MALQPSDPAPPADQIPSDQAKIREKWLREELRANRTLLLGLLQWGVTVLAAVETSLYYVRRDATKHLIDLGQLKPEQPLPLLRWGLGTVFLTILAYIFFRLTDYVVQRHGFYRDQLITMSPSYSGIQEQSRGGRINTIHHYIFFLFPAFDVVLWVYFYVGEVIIHVPF